jgi:hypothetical protein
MVVDRDHEQLRLGQRSVASRSGCACGRTGSKSWRTTRNENVDPNSLHATTDLQQTRPGSQRRLRKDHFLPPLLDLREQAFLLFARVAVDVPVSACGKAIAKSAKRDPSSGAIR